MLELAETNLYRQAMEQELAKWERAMLRKPGLRNRAAAALQGRMQRLVPKRVQSFLTLAIARMTHVILGGSRLLTSSVRTQGVSLAESDYLVERAFQTYHRAALAQGFGFGLGGLLLGLADFPALLSIKVKFLFDCAKYYGFDVDLESERLFLLTVFQLAFCSDARRLELYPVLKRWRTEAPEGVDWERFQTEYRNYIDLAKLLQLLPVVGALAGASANHRLMHKLKHTAMNCYRMRVLDALRQTDGLAQREGEGKD